MPLAHTHPPHKQVERALSAAVPKANQLAKATLRDFPGGGLWLVECADRALERTMSHKVASDAMGIDKGQLSNELKGVGHLSVKRLGLLGPDFFEAWIDEIRAHFNLSDDEERLRRAIAMRAKADEEIERIARKALR